jgi:beta-glucanase (GH16 family)
MHGRPGFFFLNEIMKRIALLATVSFSATLLLGCRDTPTGNADTWTLAWSDEFEGAAGSPPSPAIWSPEVGTGWGNAQLEYDTDRPSNAALDGAGNLVITARREAFGGQQYTSARLTTAGKRAVLYGKVEARMMLPRGQGMWPAFWMLGADVATVGWPATGEIDIMEYRGQEPGTVIGSLHGPGYSGGGALTRRYTPAATRFDNAFHVFTIEWTTDRVDWFVDGTHYFAARKDAVPGRWAFDHPFNIILNLAVGGNFVGAPNEFTTFPQAMVVDWVRVYQRAQ